MLFHISFPELELLVLFSTITISQSQFVWKSHTKKDNNTIHLPLKFINMGEPTTNFRTRTNELNRYSLDEKCEKGLGLGVGFQVYTPYVDLGLDSNSKDAVLSGIFPNFLTEMLRYCCPKSDVAYANYIASINDLGKLYYCKKSLQARGI